MGEAWPVDIQFLIRIAGLGLSTMEVSRAREEKAAS